MIRWSVDGIEFATMPEGFGEMEIRGARRAQPYNDYHISSHASAQLNHMALSHGRTVRSA